MHWLSWNTHVVCFIIPHFPSSYEDHPEDKEKEKKTQDTDKDDKKEVKKEK